MTTSSARPDYLQRYATFVADRSNAARLASTRAAVAVAAYQSSSVDVPVTVDASAVTDLALTRSDGMVARVRRVAAAFTIADRSDHPVVVIDDEQFGRMLLGAITATGGSPDGASDDDDDHTEVLFGRGFGLGGGGTHTLGPAVVRGSYEVFGGAEVTRRSFFDLDENGLDTAIEVKGFTGLRMEADGSVEAGVVSGRGHVETSVGAEASLGANARVTFDEVHVDVTGGAFLGGRAGLDADLEAMGVQAKGAAEVRAGIGADFSGEGHLGWDRVGFEFSGGLALGLGAGGRGGVSVNPRETVNDAARIGTRVQSDASKVAKVARAKTEEVIDDGLDLAGDAYRGGREVFDDSLDFARNPLGRTGVVSFEPHLPSGRGDG